MRALVLLFVSIFGLIFSSSVCAQIPLGSSARNIPEEVKQLEGRVAEVINRAEDHFKRGKLNLDDNKLDQARDEFDVAVNTVLESGIDVRTSQRLQTFYLELIECISREEVPAQALNRTTTVAPARTQTSAPREIGFHEQKFESSPLDDLSKLTLTPEEQNVSPQDITALEPAKVKSLLGQAPRQLQDGRVPVILRYLEENLNDPYSMKFISWSKIQKTYRHNEAYWHVQLRLRAKNSFGAYILKDVGFYLRHNKVVLTENL